MIELNKIYNQNCEHTMALMPDNFIDLTVTSPPYDKLRAYNGFDFNFIHIANELYRVTKPGGVIVWVVADSTVNGSESGSSFRQALYFMKCGFNLHDTMMYAKKNFIPLTHNRYEQAFEYMFAFSKGKPKTFNPIKIDCHTFGDEYNYKNKGSNVVNGGFRRSDRIVKTHSSKLRSNIFYYSTGGTRTGHPAPFPEQLAADQIISWSNEGDLIYDPFGGSGTTGKIAKILNRNWILSEISQEYSDISEKRIFNSPTLFDVV